MNRSPRIPVTGRGSATNSPDISVVLPVHNGEEHLSEAIDSILSQQSVELELIVVDDASTDASRSLAQSFSDPRIQVIALAQNVGLAAALNVGVRAARAPLIARQDQDDVSHVCRLKTQIHHIRANPDVVLLGTWARIISPKGNGWHQDGTHHHPSDDDELRVRLLWNNPFVHSSVVFRRSAFEHVGGYGLDPLRSWPEDFDLWCRLAKVGRIANLPQTLVTYRQTADGMSRSQGLRMRSGVARIAAQNLAEATGYDQDDKHVQGIVRALNGFDDEAVGLKDVIRRGLLFWAASGNVRRGGRHLWATRARWTVKILIRSLKPKAIASPG